VPTLAETQSLFRRAVVAGDAAGVAPLLEMRWRKRLTIHRRNYQSSLVNALLGKFPAVTWLVGTPFITEAAECFVELHPPQKPCIAEYGDMFPGFLSARSGAASLPYLEGFAALEWHIGHVTVAVEQLPLTIGEISAVDPEKLPDLRLALQPGVRYLRAAWPVDDLMKLYLTCAAPDRLVFDPADVFLEIRGSRGEFHMNRLEEAEFRFRECLVDGLPIGDAAEHAANVIDAFNAGTSLIRLISEDLVIGMTAPEQEDIL
jgi:hypothetical protein